MVMKTQITITCPSCLAVGIKKNGIKSYGKQKLFFAKIVINNLFIIYSLLTKIANLT